MREFIGTRELAESAATKVNTWLVDVGSLSEYDSTVLSEYNSTVTARPRGHGFGLECAGSHHETYFMEERVVEAIVCYG